MTLPLPPLHFAVKTGDISCLNGLVCCVGSSGGSSVSINQTQKNTKNNSNNQTGTESKSLDTNDNTGGMIDQRASLIGINIPVSFLNKTVLYNSNSEELYIPKKEKEATLEKKQGTIASYYDRNAKAYGSEIMALYASYSGINFSQLYLEGKSFLVKYDVAIHSAAEEIKTILEKVKLVFKQFTATSNELDKEVGEVTEQFKELEMDEEKKEQNLPSKTTGLQKIHKQFQLAVSKICGKLHITPVATTLDKITVLTSKGLENAASNFVTFTQEEGREIVQLAKAIHSVWEEKKCTTLGETLEAMSTMSKNELLEKALN